jgi:hypothetical protein
MAIKVASSLHPNRYGILYFRMAVPADIQHRFTSKEIYRSLRTSSIREATDAAARARGGMGGRPKLLDPVKLALALRMHQDEKCSIKEVCQAMGSPSRRYTTWPGRHRCHPGREQILLDRTLGTWAPWPTSGTTVANLPSRRSLP